MRVHIITAVSADGTQRSIIGYDTNLKLAKIELKSLTALVEPHYPFIVVETVPVGVFKEVFKDAWYTYKGDKWVACKRPI